MERRRPPTKHRKLPTKEKDHSHGVVLKIFQKIKKPIFIIYTTQNIDNYTFFLVSSIEKTSFVSGLYST